LTELDLNDMSLAELKALEKIVSKAIKSFEERRKNDALAALEAKAKELGFHRPLRSTVIPKLKRLRRQSTATLKTLNSLGHAEDVSPHGSMKLPKQEHPPTIF